MLNFLNLEQVVTKTTLCKSTIYELMKNGEFPKNFTVLGKRKAWNEKEVEDWMMSKIEQADL
ncbi:AlpA family phage regulatory protein [Vibrio parahaemolyticus]|uniref:helix-turn-helix transcriptional regulator n=1 Tax=Vibrio parahaemolyticus TaxID=670 RepID=UPI0013760A3C|nr:AlpA family phage regulatory protein [Vibrio parahaemolyticus]EJG1700727.1 AlpA family phage regulatory protein [Vibrio parahaemolyticus]ELB2824990.1 AlpA family phage regulatory protein [Vibrio parahaemolyticus]MBM5148988.1 AlpA family phage regulatory protein [Vibrio parahaemolyticus]MBM5153723.1 AlpA family phage regulatory protein [Vibrio parahaemolyticus]MBM5157255.1 AlpA family phage regulatory protein [Vibrio parahaemolyticus]